MKIGLVIASAWFAGAVFSRKSRMAGSRSSPYSTRRKISPVPGVCQKCHQVGRPDESIEQQMRSLY